MGGSEDGGERVTNGGTGWVGELPVVPVYVNFIEGFEARIYLRVSFCMFHVLYRGRFPGA